ncbi:ABC transporter ATP-binding protein [Bacillus sp. Bva_UNVM-123]|uniref:ABC transporter ATP-binding protein n=1 Tax=Bacillus sp. Bva_UNVM-123 TaxID=2829798 RepID=UPI00391F1807
MDKIIFFKDVSWRRSGQEILSNITWEINKHEHWAVLGLNGSGKTSLLNIVTGYQFPSSGQVEVLGCPFGRTNLPELRRKIGFVSSSLDRFSPTLNFQTIEEIVLSGLFASVGLYEKVSKADLEKAEFLISRLRLNYLKGKTFQFFSQGEKRRALIARALMSDPSILILDEPCSGLDILSREEVLAIIKEITRSHCHLIYVTHHIEELVEEITHVLLLQNGKMIAAGPKHDIITDSYLSEAFCTPVQVQWQGNRPWLSVISESSSTQTVGR